MVNVKKHLEDLYRTKPFTRHNCLCLDMNEGMPGLPKPFIRRIVSKITNNFLALYPEYQELKNTIAAHNDLAAENICLSNGSDAAIKYIFDAYISAGDKVLITDPTFAMYPVYCRMFKARPLVIKYSDNLSFPMDGYLKMLSRWVRMAVVVNPNNPTGTALKVKELLPIIKKAYCNDILLIIDEAYFYFCPETAIQLIKKFNNLVVLRTFSKLCGLAGLRIGYAAASSTIVNNLKKIRPTYDVNSVAALFAEELLNDSDIINEVLSQMNIGADYLIERLKSEGIEYRRGAANFILIKCGDNVSRLVRCLEGKGILVNGNFKQPFLKDYLRVTISSRKYMKLFWNAFVSEWKRNNHKKSLSA